MILSPCLWLSAFSFVSVIPTFVSVIPATVAAIPAARLFSQEGDHARKHMTHLELIQKESRASAPDEAGDEAADLGDAAAEVRGWNVEHVEQQNERQDGEVDDAAWK
jgi:hypothetical protein